MTDEDPKRFREVESNGPNERPRDEPIGQTNGGLPDDTSSIIEIDPDEERLIAEKLKAPAPPQR